MFGTGPFHVRGANSSATDVRTNLFEFGVTLLQLYGMSEAGWICGNRHDRRRMGTVGPPARHQEFIIVDGDGAPCPPGLEGEVTVGGPQTSRATISPEGLWEDHSRLRLATGDLAVMDEDGFVRVTGRTKDLIIRGGVNIAPLEIDHILMRHDDILEPPPSACPIRSMARRSCAMSSPTPEASSAKPR